MILTTLTRDIQGEKFIEDESVSHEQSDSMYCILISINYSCYLRKLTKYSKNSNCATPDTRNH